VSIEAAIAADTGQAAGVLGDRPGLDEPARPDGEADLTAARAEDLAGGT
jgi:hypothetical protein